MRIVHLSKYYPPAVGGIENNARQAAEVSATVFPSSDAIVISSNHEFGLRVSRTERGGLHVLRLPTAFCAKSLPVSIGWLYSLVSLSKVRLIHVHTPNPLAEFAALLTRRSSRIIVTDHGPVISKGPAQMARRIFFRALLRRSDAVIVYTDIFGKSHPDLVGLQEKIHVIPHGFDPLDYELDAEGNQKVLQLKALFADPIILFVGRLVEYKGVDLLLEAFGRLQQPAFLLIVGDGPDRAKLEALSDKLSGRDRVRFVGPLDPKGLVPYFHAADVLVLPSTTAQESFGQVLVEAALAGLPAVATRVSTGVEEIVIDGETGFLVAKGDSGAIAKRVADLLESPDLRLKLGRKAREMAIQRYSVQKTRFLLEELYKDVMNV